ncbi:MAG: cyclic nucleotide-binding domain-containing protein [Puniceicoccaceae bacterium]
MKEFKPVPDIASLDTMLSSVSFLGGITGEQRKCVYDYLECASYRKGEYITQHGEEPSHIYIIKSGSVDLIIEDEEVTVVKRTFREGDFFGEAAMLSLINNTASFRAAEESEIIVFSRKAFNRLRKEDPNVFSHLILNLARELARKLQFSDEILLHPKR